MKNWTRPMLYFLFSLLILSSFCFAQKSTNDLTFYKPTTTYSGKPDTILTMDFSNISRPESVKSFHSLGHLPPVRQDTTGTCWAFAATSFLESELMRLGKGKVKLSEMYVVYHEYVEKARGFVRSKGKSNFEQGSEVNAAIERVKKYGIVRLSDYSGLLPGQKYHSHGKMFREMKKYLQFIKDNHNWDEQMVVVNIKMILDKHLGKPPSIIMVDEKKLTPIEYANKVLNLPLDDYVSLMSFKYIPFYTMGEFKVPDNWWHCKNYHNIPLDEWYQAIKQAVKRGYTVALGGDVTEVGKYGEQDIAIVPPFDIDFEHINQDAREFRFYNETSQDDHAIHLVGYQHFSHHDWFLIKDSGYSATKGKFKGYYFFRGDYLKLKMLNFMVHKNAVKDIINKF